MGYSATVDYLVLTDWEKETEEGIWKETYDRSPNSPVKLWESIELFVYYIIERYNRGIGYIPYFFDSLKEAKEAVCIIKAHNQPRARYTKKSPKYFIIKSEVKTIPSKYLESLEV